MAYKKIGFKDRIDNKPTTYLVDGKSTEIIKDDTDVEEEGTNLNATNLNHMEDGILQNSRDIEILNKQIINIKVPVESVNGKTGDVELKAQDIKSKSGTTLEDFKSNTEEEIKNLKSSVDNGKSSLYSAIVDKKVTPRSKDFDDLAKGIREIKLGQGNAQPNDVLEGKTFTNAEGNLLTGKMKNYGSKIITPSKEIQTLTKGYYDSVKVNPIEKNVLQKNFPELKPENIKSGVEVGGIVGSAKTLERITHVFYVTGENFKKVLDVTKPQSRYIQIPEGFELHGYVFTGTVTFKDSLYTGTTVKHLMGGSTNVKQWEKEFKSAEIQFIHESTKYIVGFSGYTKFPNAIELYFKATNDYFLQHMNLQIDCELIIF